MFVAALEEGQDENDLEVETIEEMVRTTSGTEMQEGSFELPVEGVLFFVWDNSFDWSANKKLSYSIEVIQVKAQNNFEKLSKHSCLSVPAFVFTS